MKSGKPPIALLNLPDSKGMTEVNGENGRASCRVKGRENLAFCPDGCADDIGPFCTPLELTGPWYAIVIVIRAQNAQP